MCPEHDKESQDKLNPQKKAFKSLSVKADESPNSPAARRLPKKKDEGKEGGPVAASESVPNSVSKTSGKIEDALNLDAELNPVK